MEATKARINLRGVARERRTPREVRRNSRLGLVSVISSAIAVLMVVASLAGLLADDLYRDGAWAREALRGGDLTTLVLVVPILIWAVLLSRRGSMRGRVIWLGTLGYGVYNYAYYVFGAAFNDMFLVHVALLSLSIWATALLATNIDLASTGRGFRLDGVTRGVGGFLVIVGSVLGGLWVALAIRFALTGELMADVPEDGVHLVFGIDLSLLVPALIVAGVVLWRRTTLGVVFGSAMIVLGALYQANLLVSGVFQANADVPGAKALPLEGVVVASGFAASFALMFGRRTGRMWSEAT